MFRMYMQQLKENKSGIINAADMILCTLLYGASPNNYQEFDFDNLNWKERSTYVTNGLSRKIIRKCNQASYVDFFEDKIKFATRFERYFGRQWTSTVGLTYEKFSTFVSGKDKLIYKPVENAQGKGIKVFSQLDDLQHVYESIQKASEKAIIEEWILQHPALSTMYNKAINCLRIITFYNNGNVTFLAGGVTWGNGMDIANVCASGIVSPVNFENGVLEKPAADFSGRIYEKHPITGASLVGFELPFWKETKLMLEAAAAEIPQVAYIGWDIAITPTGPILIEGNTTPGYKYYQIPAHMENKKGNRALYASCLKERN